MTDDIREKLVAESQGTTKAERGVFVIMPFVAALARNREDLTRFFERDIKAAIESDNNFEFRYRVWRSGESFQITKQIISDLFRAHIVVCDLSGEKANPNVMYELGIRLSCSNRPVILLREESPSNQDIFDITGLYVHSYRSASPESVHDYLRRTILRFEREEEYFTSPVLEILRAEASLEVLGRSKVVALVDILQLGLQSQVIALASSMSRHVDSATGGELVLDPNIGSFHGELKAKASQLAKLDWSGPQFVVTPHPGLIYFLSTHYLFGAVEEKIEVALTRALLIYHGRFFGNMSWWFGLTVPTAIDFVEWTLLLAHAMGLLRMILQSESGTTKHLEAREGLLTLTRNLVGEIP